MIGRRLERDVERHLQPEAVGDGDEPIEIVERAEPRLDRRVAAVLGADGPRAAGIAGRGGQRVVAALAVRAADRMDRRQVQHVEAHGRDLGQPGLGFAKRAAASGSDVHERGNISYHALNRARTGSTVTRSVRSYVVDALRSGRASISASNRGSRAAATRASCGTELRSMSAISSSAR